VGDTTRLLIRARPSKILTTVRPSASLEVWDSLESKLASDTRSRPSSRTYLDVLSSDVVQEVAMNSIVLGERSSGQRQVERGVMGNLCQVTVYL
jgi:hypothetical protein